MFHVELCCRRLPSPLDSIHAELNEIEARGLRRQLRPVLGAQAAEIALVGGIALNFSSNNYLGLADSPLLQLAASRAMLDHGFGAGASRLIVGNLTPHRALETRIAQWKSTESALLFNSGYHANVGVVSALAGPEDVIFSDALNHASLIDGCRLSRARTVVFPHRDLAALETVLAREPGRRRLILSDTIFSMDGDRADVAGLAALARKHEALLVIDEAHEVGVQAGDIPVDLRIGTLGKALGSFGAYAAGARPLIDLLLHKARSFVFTTALPVPVVAASHAAIDWLETDEGRERCAQLAENCRYFHERRGRAGVPSHIVPILVRDGDPRRAVAACDALLERGIFAQAIRPPTVPAGTSRLRFSIMATHSRAHLDRALAALDELRDHFV
jgi:8-amino-7-oxononanoate synthase